MWFSSIVLVELALRGLSCCRWRPLKEELGLVVCASVERLRYLGDCRVAGCRSDTRGLACLGAEVSFSASSRCYVVKCVGVRRSRGFGGSVRRRGDSGVFLVPRFPAPGAARQ